MLSIPYIAITLTITSNMFTKVWLNMAAETTKKTILHWYSRDDVWPPPKYYGTGNKIFVQNNCSFINCFVYHRFGRKVFHPTNDDFNSSTFDAIIFNGIHLNNLAPKNLPVHRRPEQIFIFLLLESADRCPVCLNVYDDFFNWTITYRLDSDIPWPYFIVKTFDNKTVGPGERVNWIPQNKLKNISVELERIVNNKWKMAAWFVSRCKTLRHREDYVESLNVELLKLTRQHVDTYGACGEKKCHKNESNRCASLLQRDYFFYMAMENSFGEDYVTEKFSRGMMYGAVPIVFGGANYSRFAPPGSFIDARRHTPKKLAAIMLNLIRNRTRYHNYLRWRNHYFYANNMQMSHVVCRLCAKLNDNTKTKRYKEFRRWWNRNYERRCEALRKTRRRI